VSDQETAEAMIRYGGNFVRALADLYRQADDENRARIKATWSEYWRKYDDIAKAQMSPPVEDRS